MQLLTDCDIIEYCNSSPEERDEAFQRAVDIVVKPIYQLPVFELCHALHILVKHQGVSPSTFRKCWADFCKRHIECGEFFIHVSNELADKLCEVLNGLPVSLPENLEAPCGDNDRYWGHNKHLVYRIQKTYMLDTIVNGWCANPPEEISEQPSLKEHTQDVVLDTNNLIELVNQLPSDGFIAEIKINFPARLPEGTQRKFFEIIRTRGVAGKFIIPISTLEEALWVIYKPANLEKYANAQRAFRSMLIDRDNSLWNMFDFQPITQETFDYFLLLYERLAECGVDFADFDDFGDLLVLAHGLSHGCKIATNEWFEGETDVWDKVAPLFPFLVLEK